ncbi:MAG: hypothetical protein OSB12_08695 [Planctomycetota bacterium]|nr:hypothetical protein [Planctomycetota bacterium]
MSSRKPVRDGRSNATPERRGSAAREPQPQTTEDAAESGTRRPAKPSKRPAEKRPAEKRPAEKQSAEKRPAEKQSAEKRPAERRPSPDWPSYADSKRGPDPEAKPRSPAAAKPARKESRQQKPPAAAPESPPAASTPPPKRSATSDFKPDDWTIPEA